MKRRTVTLLGLTALLTWGGLTMPGAHARRRDSADANKAAVRRLIEEAMNRGNMSVIDELIHATYVSRGRTAAQDIRGPEGFRTFVTRIRAPFPDFHIHVEDQIAEGDKVVTRFVVHGTHKGEFPAGPTGALAPTGKQIQMRGITITRFMDGKIVEGWAVVDELGLLQQLGALPAGAPADRPAPAERAE